MFIPVIPPVPVTYTPAPEQQAQIERALEILGCQAQQLAALVGCSRQHLGNVRRGRYRLSARHEARLKEVLAEAELEVGA